MRFTSLLLVYERLTRYYDLHLRVTLYNVSDTVQYIKLERSTPGHRTVSKTLLTIKLVDFQCVIDRDFCRSRADLEDKLGDIGCCRLSPNLHAVLQRL